MLMLVTKVSSCLSPSVPMLVNIVTPKIKLFLICFLIATEVAKLTTLVFLQCCQGMGKGRWE